MSDRHGRITLVNSETERMFGYDRDELLGQTVETLIPDRFREQHVADRQEFFHSPRLRAMGESVELWGLRKDGTEFPLDVRLSPISTPSGPSVLAAVVDVTDRKRLESSLRQQVVQRERFLATLSHELRNPIAAILTAASILNRIAGDSAEISQPSAVIRRQASQIAALLDDLLDVSRVTQNKIALRREAVDVTLLVKEAIEAVTPLIALHRHDVSLDAPDEPLWLDVDRSRIIQVIENLLTNATKYTPDGGNIWVTLSCEADQAVIRVRDNGHGIAQELLGSMFDMFVQADESLDRSQGGMGMGLTLVRSLVELHGGTIEAHSDGVNHGSEFAVRLPLTSKYSQHIEAEVELDSKSVRLIVVEDSDDSREMLAALLKMGFLVQTASNGQEGLEAILREKPDVALLDIGLPGLEQLLFARS